LKLSTLILFALVSQQFALNQRKQDKTRQNLLKYIFCFSSRLHIKNNLLLERWSVITLPLQRKAQADACCKFC